MNIAIIKEKGVVEQRVALIPDNVKRLVAKQLKVTVEASAGELSGFTDDDYRSAGAEVISDRALLLENADIIVAVDLKQDQLEELSNHSPKKQCLIGMMDPLAQTEQMNALCQTGKTAFALELIPRSTRAQSMDVLSSMATISGYKSVLIAACRAPRIYPMLMTAAGTLKPARVFIMGVGVAGLQACATAKRLGAVVEAYDIRPAAREQIISVGAKPVDLNIEAENTETKGGYAMAQSDDFIKRQQEAMASILAQQDVVITTAAIPGRKAPILITDEMVAAMKPGAVIIDLAAETGGNCALTQLDTEVVSNGVVILGPSNIPSTVPNHASQMYGKNVENLLSLLFDKEGNMDLNFDDEIIAETVVCHEGNIISSRMKSLIEVIDKSVAEEVS